MADRSVLERRSCECHAARGLVKFCALHEAAPEMLKALGVIGLDQRIAAWLGQNDPQALKQVRAAIAAAKDER